MSDPRIPVLKSPPVVFGMQPMLEAHTLKFYEGIVGTHFREQSRVLGTCIRVTSINQHGDILSFGGGFYFQKGWLTVINQNFLNDE